MTKLISCLYRYLLFFTFIFCIGWKGLNGISIKNAVHSFFDYFKTEDPRGIPVINLEGPLEIISPLETVPVTLYNGRVFGLSNIKIEHVFLDFLSLTGSLKLSGPRIELNGNYKWPSVFSESNGFLNATAFDMVLEADFSMFIDQEYNLQVSNLELNETSDDVHLNLTNLVWAHQLILESGVVHMFFDDIVAELFRQIKPILLDEINREISKFISSLPSVEFFVSSEEEASSPPLSSEKSKSKALATLLHRFLLFLGMEQLHLPERNTRILGLDFKVDQLVMYGASNVSKIESLNIYYEFKKLNIEAAMIYPKLLLFYQVKMTNGKSINMDFYEKNQLNNVYVKILVDVDLSLEKPPEVTYFDIHVESFGKLRERKEKSFWRTLVDAFKNFRDLILREIVNALQGTIQKTFQKKLNTTDVENGLQYLLERIYSNN